MTHSKYWTELNKLLDISFPKGDCQERGRALFLVATIDMLLSENQFTDVSKMVDPKPTKEECGRTLPTGYICASDLPCPLHVKPQEAKVEECKQCEEQCLHCGYYCTGKTAFCTKYHEHKPSQEIDNKTSYSGFPNNSTVKHSSLCPVSNDYTDCCCTSPIKPEPVMQTESWEDEFYSLMKSIYPHIPGGYSLVENFVSTLLTKAREEDKVEECVCLYKRNPKDKRCMDCLKPNSPIDTDKDRE